MPTNETYKYLDFEGLGHFWSKIKTYVNNTVVRYDTMQKAEVEAGSNTDPRVITAKVLHDYTKATAEQMAEDEVASAIKTQSVTISSVAINNNAWADISSSTPTAPTGYTLLAATFESWSNMTTKGPISVTIDGHYAIGPAGTTISNLKVKYYFIKTAMLSS